jgi:two-component system response regulator PilR (NtrC family)
MRLPDGDGIELVRFIGSNWPQLPVAVITAHGNMQSAIESLKAGAYDFVSKPVDLKILRNLVETALKLPLTSSQSQPMKCEIGGNGQQLLGSSQAIEAIRAMTLKLSRNQAPVHISGESGTGKELAARMIHCQGPRSDKPFIAVNCGAVPQELMESEFFGHIKGSFTGAISDKKGLFQAADHGTLFLDEVADLPLSMQVKLLRAIQEKSIRPVGGTSEVSIDVRIVSATHKDLHKLVNEGSFRQDLFYRINVIELNLPSLRHHKEDLPALIDYFLKRISENNQIIKPKIEKSTLQQLLDYDYPGNVRELENIMEGAIALHEDGHIVRRDLKLNRSKQPRHISASQTGSLEEQLESFEKHLIEQALNSYQWNRTATAEQLGISLRQLRYKMEKLGLDQATE